MTTMLTKTLFLLLGAGWLGSGMLSAQAEPTPPKAGTTEGKSAQPVRAKVTLSEAGRTALAVAKDLVAKVKGLRGGERTQALGEAAAAYDKVVADFASEPMVAAAAAFAAGELWRQHGSLALAEKDYLLAAETDGPRFGQRALLAAADAMRRQKRHDEALATYQKAAAAEPNTPRAQEARLWVGRVLQSLGKIDEAVTAFQAALESARPGKQVIDTANFLALACIEKGDLDAAERAIDLADEVPGSAGEDDPIVADRLKKAAEAMTAKKALQRARDRATRAGKDAVGFEQGQKASGN